LTPHPALDGSVRGRPDIEGDTRRMIDVLTNGGVALVPANLGYALVGSTPEANRRIIAAKRREGHKRQGIVMDAITEREVHILDQRKRDIVDCITIDYNLPLGVIAKYRKDHPLMQSLDPFLLKIGTARGTIGTALNDGGIFHEALGKYSREHLWPFLGSSANLTGQGARFRVPVPLLRHDFHPDQLRDDGGASDRRLLRSDFRHIEAAFRLGNPSGSRQARESVRALAGVRPGWCRRLAAGSTASGASFGAVSSRYPLAMGDERGGIHCLSSK
jgi:hypothetical protein